MSTRTQVSYLSPALSHPPPPVGRKLRKEERDRGGNVLPNASGTGYGQTNGNGLVANGTGYGRPEGAPRHHHLAPRLQATLAQAKQRHGRNSDDISRRNMVIDEEGVAHDSECESCRSSRERMRGADPARCFLPSDVQFRTATPVHLHSRRHQAVPDDDDSASSSSASSSSSTGSRFPSSPYTYQSTHRTASTHHYAAPLGTTASAIPGYLGQTPRRSSVDYLSSSLAVPRAPSPRRSSAEYERPAYGGKVSSKSRHAPPPAQFTTSSYQPPAPAFQPRAMDYTTSLRLPPTRAMSSDTNSLTESAARLVLGDNGGSGYNQFASTRPPQLDGSALDAGVHGMKRSWDGFKLEVKFGAHKVSKKISRKITNL